MNGPIDATFYAGAAHLGEAGLEIVSIHEPSERFDPGDPEPVFFESHRGV